MDIIGAPFALLGRMFRIVHYEPAIWRGSIARIVGSPASSGSQLPEPICGLLLPRQIGKCAVAKAKDGVYTFIRNLAGQPSQAGFHVEPSW
jgi:hypothetical protein